MAQDYTVKAFTDKNKPDKFGNFTYSVVFEEDERPVYLASKTPLTIGMKKYGSIQDNEYGSRFKSEQKMDGGFTPQVGTGYSSNSSSSPKKSDDERSKDIRWGLSIKEANAYVIANRPNLDAGKWAAEVNEYANALFSISDGPKSDVKTIIDNEPDAEDVTDKINLADIPF